MANYTAGRNWTPSELKNLATAHQRKVCGLNPKWGKCAHLQCKALWTLTPETATEAERAAIWPLLAGAVIEVEVPTAEKKGLEFPLFG
jgi:hypothetical protein